MKVPLSIVILIVVLTGPTSLLAIAENASPAWQRHTIDRSSRGADGVRLRDVNGDRRPDIVTGWEEGGQIRVYLHPGKQTVQQTWPAVTVGRVRSPEDAVFVDLDRDGAIDVVSSCEGKNKTMFVHWAPTDRNAYLDEKAWVTQAIPATRQQQAWMYSLPLDVDGRHGTDLVVGSKGNQASIGWLESPADPRQLDQWRYHRWYDAGWVMSLIATDMDDDGDPDVLASDRKGANRGLLWIENPGVAPSTPPPIWRARRLGGEDREVMFLDRADLLQVGRRQIVAAVRGRGVYLVDEQQTFEIPLPSSMGTGKSVAVGDLDGDRRPDLVVSCENARDDLSGVRWFSRNEVGSWQDHEISGPDGTKYDRLELVDLDEDGDLDVLTCEETRNLGVVWFENPR